MNDAPASKMKTEKFLRKVYSQRQLNTKKIDHVAQTFGDKIESTHNADHPFTMKLGRELKSSKVIGMFSAFGWVAILIAVVVNFPVAIGLLTVAIILSFLLFLFLGLSCLDFYYDSATKIIGVSAGAIYVAVDQNIMRIPYSDFEFAVSDDDDVKLVNSRNETIKILGIFGIEASKEIASAVNRFLEMKDPSAA